MTSNATSMAQQFFTDENFLRLKYINEHGNTDQQLLQKQSKDRLSSRFPPITRNIVSALPMTNNTVESPRSSLLFTPLVREAAKRFMVRQHSSLSAEPSSTSMPPYVRPKRMSHYDHIQPKIDTGLPRKESITRKDVCTHQLGPIRSINWRLLRQQLERNREIRAQAKRIQFHSGIAYKTQLKTLVNEVQLKVRQYVASMMGSGEERYKIVVNITAFPTTASGLFVTSRCLWNTVTDNSITIQMQGVDCNILVVIFLCYTDLGPEPF
ncbi:unnamed protein product [Rotaria sordida]|uniref:Uncharacterized protein n=1 Tax=Rotaria sordida TaxID=392033 RepID=A0A818JXP7_9BILA|nr:unnamed protein product [Rotaria sordida]CAF3546034.1 unnamed protein product [Rotaria sordida]